MGLFDFFKNLFQKSAPPPKLYTARFNLNNLITRTNLNYREIARLEPVYTEFTIPKRAGGRRTILAPDPALKKIQRTLLHRLLARLRAHPNVTGFEPGHSIVTNAAVHCGTDVVLRMDIKNFFPSTTAARILDYFRSIGWDEETAELLTKLTTYQNALPQGAPTSPRLSNLVNYQMDARLFALAQKFGAVYTRYADDLTFSFGKKPAGKIRVQNPKTLEKIELPSGQSHQNRLPIALTIRAAKLILTDYGYRLHQKRKLHIRRRHQCQLVTGLVVNEKVNLPRKTRRTLRAVEHHLANGRPATLTPDQLAGFRALQHMIRTQSAPPAE